MTNGLSSMRTALDPSWRAPNGPQDLVGTSVAYGTYMAVSSNLRYQIVAGVSTYMCMCVCMRVLEGESGRVSIWREGERWRMVMWLVWCDVM
jgi:hypothetical protein